MARVKSSHRKAGFWFLGGVVCFPQFLPTKRAADGGESARFTSIFLALSFFYISNLFLPRPRPPLTQTVGQKYHSKEKAINTKEAIWKYNL
jgi:hypothetical protein